MELSIKKGRQGSTPGTGSKLPGARACLTVVHLQKPIRAPWSVPLAGDALTVGRYSTELADLELSDGGISRLHAQLVRSGGRWCIEDLDSKNGTFLNGERLPPGSRQVLEDGAVLRFGETVLVYRAAAPWPLDVASGHLPGVAPATVAARGQLRGLADKPGPVLILGERGTGKKAAAQMLADHDGGNPLLTFRAAPLSSSFVGTLFVEDIEELSFEQQTLLLRFLERGRPALDGTRSRARVVATSSADLHQAVLAGRFRGELLSRLTDVHLPVVLPPLRSRVEDLALWVAWFLRQGWERGAEKPEWSAGFIECLCLHDWPENLHELLRAVRVASKAKGGPLRALDLPIAIQASRSRRRRLSVGPPILRGGLSDTEGRRSIWEVLGVVRAADGEPEGP